jgi:hypothetical protein
LRVPTEGEARAKITFDLAALNADGLAGPPGGLVAYSYELCIPATPEHEAAVRRIDPTLQVQRGSRGRIGCGPGQVLCLGSTHQPGFRDVLLRLAGLDYVERIDRSFGE